MWMACRYFFAPVHLLARDDVVLLLLNHQLTCFAPLTAPEFSHLMLLLPAAPQPIQHMLSDAIVKMGAGNSAGTGGGGGGRGVLYKSSMQLGEVAHLLAFLSTSCVAVTRQLPHHEESQCGANGRLLTGCMPSTWHDMSKQHLSSEAACLFVQARPLADDAPSSLQLGLLRQGVVAQVNSLGMMLGRVAAPGLAPQPFLQCDISLP